MIYNLRKKNMKNLIYFQSLNDILDDEENIVEILTKNHKSTMGVLKERQRYLNIIQTLWTNKNFKVCYK